MNSETFEERTSFGNAVRKAHVELHVNNGKAFVFPVEVEVMKTNEFRVNEQATHQILHREAIRRFLDTLGSAQMAKKNIQQQSGKDAVIYPVAEMRELLITAMSTRLRMFHEISKSLGTDTLVQTTQEYKGKGFDGFRSVRFMATKLNLALPNPETRIEMRS